MKHLITLASAMLLLTAGAGAQHRVTTGVQPGVHVTPSATTTMHRTYTAGHRVASHPITATGGSVRKAPVHKKTFAATPAAATPGRR